MKKFLSIFEHWLFWLIVIPCLFFCACDLFGSDKLFLSGMYFACCFISFCILIERLIDLFKKRRKSFAAADDDKK